ncbi:MAG: glycoside hydrolase family 3 C-terminal domain-containing protein [Lachnospiraceae bacterium]|nr:glycoside hydrolase family 3 C-terminal domain-containing protein [Lachnospiraceae bacterium]
MTGKVNPSGKLSVSIPYRSTSLPCYYNRYAPVPQEVRTGAYNDTYQDDLQRVLYPFGYGLSYAAFEYKRIKVRKLGKNTFLVEVQIENTCT